MGVIKAICISEKRGTQKNYVESAVLKENWGIDGDAHAGDWHRQVSLISADKIADFKAKGADVTDGAFGENIIVSGIDFAALPIGTKFSNGEVLLEMTQIGKECHTHCAIYHKMGDCIMPREGVFAKVLHGGTLSVGDNLNITEDNDKKRFRAVIITLSDRCSKGEREDTGGALLAQRLKDAGYEVIDRVLIPDEKDMLSSKLIDICDRRRPNLILTTGSTGFNPRDIAPEGTLAVAEKNAPGIAEAMRAYSMKFTDRAMLSRAVSVIRGSTLIVNFPGSPKACGECFDCIAGALPHALELLGGGTFDCGRPAD